MAQIGIDTVFGHKNVLSGGTHLTGVQAQGKRQVAHHGFEVIGGIDDDGVGTGLLGVDLRLRAVLFQPVTKRGVAGKVDQFHFWTPSQGHGFRLGGIGIHKQGYDMRRQPLLFQHFLRNLDADGCRQHGTGMRLDHNRVTGHEGGKQARVGVPGREG